MIADAVQTSDCRFLKGSDQEAAEHAFDGCSAVVMFFEFFGSVGCLISRIVTYSPKIIASFLCGEVRVVSRTHKKFRFGGIWGHAPMRLLMGSATPLILVASR